MVSPISRYRADTPSGSASFKPRRTGLQPSSLHGGKLVGNRQLASTGNRRHQQLGRVEKITAALGAEAVLVGQSQHRAAEAPRIGQLDPNPAFVSHMNLLGFDGADGHPQRGATPGHKPPTRAPPPRRRCPPPVVRRGRIPVPRPASSADPISSSQPEGVSTTGLVLLSRGGLGHRDGNSVDRRRNRAQHVLDDLSSQGAPGPGLRGSTRADGPAPGTAELLHVVGGARSPAPGRPPAPGWPVAGPGWPEWTSPGSGWGGSEWCRRSAPR